MFIYIYTSTICDTADSSRGRWWRPRHRGRHGQQAGIDRSTECGQPVAIHLGPL